MLKKTKLSLAIRGIIFAALGIFCLASPRGTLESIAWVVGLVLVVAAVATFIMGRDREKGHVETMHLITAILMVVVGVLIILRPQIIAILLGVFIFVEGLDFCVDSTRYRRAGIKYWWVLLAVGVLTILLGLWAICTPWVGATMLSIVVGIGALGIAADSFTALIGLGRVERFFKELKGSSNKQLDDSEHFEEVEIVK